MKQKHDIRDFLNDTNSKRYTYTGPGAGTGAWAGIPSPFRFDPDGLHARVSSTSGGTVFIPDKLAIGGDDGVQPEPLVPAAAAPRPQCAGELHPDVRTQLFDLSVDPHELNNLATRPEYADQVADLSSRLAREMEHYGDRIPLVVPNPKSADWTPPPPGSLPTAGAKRG